MPNENEVSDFTLDKDDRSVEEKLAEPIRESSVKERKAFNGQKLKYIPAHIAFDTANKIFGYSNWNTECTQLQETSRKVYMKTKKNPDDEDKEMISIAYMAMVKLTVMIDGKSVTHEDVGNGDGTGANTAYGIVSSIELATKEALTDAKKRCLRHFGNQFGLSLYDKDNQGIVGDQEFENDRMVDEEQLATLRSLYADRDIDDEWVLGWLKGEKCPFKSIQELNQPWYFAVLATVNKYKLDEVQAKTYDADIANVLKLMSESISLNMLKPLYAEAYRKAQKNKDNKKLVEIKKLYEELKAKFEESGK